MESDLVVSVNALVGELTTCRDVYGSAWTEEWTDRAIDLWLSMGGRPDQVRFAVDSVGVEFVRANPPRLEGIVKTMGVCHDVR